MVYFYTLKTAPDLVCYMGRDKYENEDLIEYGLDEDVWFHVDDYSSAHVYLRLKEEESWENISPETLEELGQLTKHNSITGSKLASVNIIYTPWKNLHKGKDMEIGAIGYHNPKAVKTLRISKNNDIVKPIEKTKREKSDYNLKSLREKYDKNKREKARLIQKQQKDEKERQISEAKKAAELRNYSSLMKTVDRSADQTPIDEDDFM